ncbi:MAG: hypothetical protein IKL73_08875 [Lachnospiraceae bacterium]|nr:hypothetical protein [Lachnospiraceae bacterium]MBR6698352.1 hypothetical protein [Lachnospiraceae bacterium]
MDKKAILEKYDKQIIGGIQMALCFVAAAKAFKPIKDKASIKYKKKLKKDDYKYKKKRNKERLKLQKQKYKIKKKALRRKKK